jgi:hypothetical protein
MSLTALIVAPLPLRTMLHRTITQIVAAAKAGGATKGASCAYQPKMRIRN